MFTKRKALSVRERARANKAAHDAFVQIAPIDGVTFVQPNIQRKTSLEFHVRVTSDGSLSYKDICNAIIKTAQSGEMILHDEHGDPLWFGNIAASSMHPQW